VNGAAVSAGSLREEAPKPRGGLALVSLAATVSGIARTRKWSVYLRVRTRSMKRLQAIFGTSRLWAGGMLSSIILFASFRTWGEALLM
jgi:hypothetical protein